MKKKIIVALFVVGIVCITGCGVVEQLVEGAKEDIEWTKENGALTNGRSSDEQLAETIEDLTGVDISLSDEKPGTTSTGHEHEIGDTVSITSINSDGTETNLDITVTGCQQVYDRVNEKNAIAIFYTVTSKDSEQMMFDNSYFNVYADSSYVEPGYWEDYNEFSYGILMPDTSYDGCYVADVDLELVNKIDLYLGDIIFHIQKEGVPVASTSDGGYSFEAGLAYSGFYSDSNSNTCDVSFYSSPEGGTVGTFFASIGGSIYSGEMEYDEATGNYKCITSNNDELTIYFEDYEGTPSVSLCIVRVDGVIFGTDYIPMTEHYES